MRDLMLLPEIEARRILRGRAARVAVLAPYGPWAGCGTLRVLRAKFDEAGNADLVVGYESYEPLR
ncbi:MAG: hypothetical protein JO199_05835 [Candidatus Eremiobacteraeota bacterium]|nr:hypothetical protein [Candidatus Eremiobacteraeota bacterium]